MPMQLFLDESGGWTGKNRTSPHAHFTLAVVVTETDEVAAASTNAIIQARTLKHLPAGFEFHFAEITHAQRIAFFEAVSHCPFRYAAATINNTRLNGKAWKDKAYFYERVIAPVVDSLAQDLRAAQAALGKALCAKLTYDECRDPVFHAALRTQFTKLKDPSGRSLVDKVRPGRSSSSDLLQLADMVCGSAAQAFLNGSQAYRQYIQAKEAAHHVLP